jgi:hypothetical protein
MRCFSRMPATVLASALVLGCGDQQPPTAPGDTGPSLAMTAQHFIDTSHFEFSFTSDCTGELITFSGTLFTTVTIVSEPGNDNHVEVVNVLRGTATGEPSGTTYILRDMQLHNFNTPSGPAPNGTITDKEVSVLVSKGPAPNEFFSFDEHLVFTGTGEFNVVVDNERSVCQ